MKLEKSCGVICYNDQFEILLLKHNSGHHYDFCKGHLEKGETEIECALREVKEETNLDVKIESGFKVYSYYRVPQRGLKQVCWFIGKVSGEIQIQAEEIESFDWVSIDQGKDMITYQASRSVFDEFINYWMTKL